MTSLPTSPPDTTSPSQASSSDDASTNAPGPRLCRVPDRRQVSSLDKLQQRWWATRALLRLRLRRR